MRYKLPHSSEHLERPSSKFVYRVESLARSTNFNIFCSETIMLVRKRLLVSGTVYFILLRNIRFKADLK